MNYCLILTYTNDIKNAKEISHNLVSNKLAACVNILTGVESVYEWKGEVQEEKEVMVIIKTKKELFEKIEASIKEKHSYELPAIIEIEIEKGSKDFLKWVDKNTL